MLSLLSGNGVNLIVFGLAAFTFGLKVFAFGDALLRRPASFVATGKLTKVIWLAILAVALLVNLVVFNPLSFLNIIGDIAAIVYLVDVRPAIRSLGDGGSIRRRKPGKGPSGW